MTARDRDVGTAAAGLPGQKAVAVLVAVLVWREGAVLARWVLALSVLHF